MSKIPENVCDPALYVRIKQEATQRFHSPTSAYRSMWIVKTYKSRGGKYKVGFPEKNDTRRWLREKWVQVIPYVTKGVEIECGSGSYGKACRPLLRVDKKTPLTMKQVLSKWGVEKVLRLAKKKNKNMSGRLDWVGGVFVRKR